MTKINMNNVMKIFLLVKLSIRISESLIPVDRFWPGLVIVDKRIYFFGGATYNMGKFIVGLDEMFYLDVSKPFNTANPPFEEIKFHLEVH